MLGTSDLEKLREAYSVYNDVTVADALRQIGNPSQEAIVDLAVSQMSHADRNVRVLALRVLQHQRGDVAMRGVLAGLNDEKRRVCAVAIQASANYLGNQDIVARLEEMARDAGLKRKLRRRALSMLAGNEGRRRGDLTAAASASLKRLMAEREYRFAILFGLVRLESAPRVASLLEEFARSNDAAERQIAARALAGERIIHIDNYAADEATQRRIMETCDIAHGRMYCWLPRADLGGCQAHPPAPSPRHKAGGASPFQ